MKKIAVLTGDLVNSTGVGDPKAFTQQLRALLKQTKTLYQGEATTFRGDGFQVAIPTPERAVACAIYLRAGLIASSPSKRERWDARIAIAIADAKQPNDPFGDAFIKSGRGLDNMSKAKFYLYGEPQVFQLSAALASDFVDDIISHWTPSEAEAYFVYLTEPGGHKAVALKLNKSRTTITKTLLRAKYTLIDRYLTDINKLMELTHAS